MKRLWYIALAVLAFKLCLFWGLLKFTGDFLVTAGAMLAIKFLVIPGLVVVYMWFKGVFRDIGSNSYQPDQKFRSKNKSLSGKRAGKGGSPDKTLVSSSKTVS